MRRLAKAKNYRPVDKPHVCGFCRYHWESPDGQTWGCVRRDHAGPMQAGHALSRSQYRHVCDRWEEYKI